ncbi:P-loop containing nucleoside triphosphate hydrolase protein [Penicillium malachiteum]|nr:P-loop containing nucleoside triphosphate hydrolase protein [Penicillium malachiteum]
MAVCESDRSFGPRVNPQCRNFKFDFTLTFEHGFFHLLPSSLFLLAFPIWFFLSRKEQKKSRSNKLCVLKALPRLRTLWLIGESISPLPVLWTYVFIATLAVLGAELIPKKRFLYTKYQNTTREERSDVWTDLPPINAPLQATETLVGLRAGWKSSKKRCGSHLMLQAVFRAYLVPFLTAIIPRLCLTVFTFCQSFLITQAVSYFEESDSSDSVDIGHALIGAYALVYLGYALSTAIYWRQTFRFVAMVRRGLISILQRKSTQVKAIDLEDFAALTLMGTDVERIRTGFRSILELRASPIETAIGIWLLARQVGVASVVPAVISMSNFPVDIASMATFLLFSIIALVKGDGILLSTQAFTSLSLISLMTTPSMKFIKAFLGGYFRQHGITVVMATHSRQLISQADSVILLDAGKIQFQGQYSELPSNYNLGTMTDLETILLVNGDFDQSMMVAVGFHQDASLRAEKSEELVHVPDIQIEETLGDGDSELDSVSDDSRRKGTWSVYQYYCRSAGYLLCITFVVFLGINALTTNFPTANTEHPNQKIGMYLGVYAMFSVVAVVSLGIASWALIIGMVTNTPLTLHSDVLKTTGQFSQDMDLIDIKLPIISINVFSEAANCVTKMVILCAVSKYLSVVFPPLLAVIYAIQRCYLRTSRQVRLLDIEARSPLFNHFLETIQGVATIRAFGWQPQNQVRGKSLLNDSQRPAFILYCVQQWLAFVLDLTIAAVAVTVVETTTALRDQFSAGSIGVALNMVFTFSQSLNYMIQYWAQTEISIGAVARVERFVQETPSEERDIPTRTLEPGWPSQGHIQFGNVKVQTGDDNQVILDNISLSINSGEKIAICGSSGSGKTSFILALLQMIELKEGSIQIDGQNLAELQPQGIISRLNVIPQEPLIMPGTIRLNLDPTSSSHENAIENALRRVGLADRIEEMGGLDSTISSSAWSVVELQLLSLARAMIKHSSILILDEAMSSIDTETERLMQEIVDRHFSGQTVLAVVHRLAYIHPFDRVLVLKKGRIVEWDTPKALLSRDSELRKLYDAYK